jgi:tRNA (guanine-N7-)-methyltransferase
MSGSVLIAVRVRVPRRKRKHQKRRIVQPALARALAERLAPGGVVFLQSDVKAVAEDMVAVFEAAAGSDLLELAAVHFGDGASGDWPPPEAALVNQGNDVQREASKAAARAKARAEAAASRKRPRDDAEAGEAAADDGAAGEDEGDEAEGGDDDYDPFAPTGWAKLPGNGWLRDNPVGVPTERELGTVAAGGHCWRALLRRKDVPVPAAEAPAA